MMIIGNDKGASLVEYGILAGLIGVLAVSAVVAVGVEVEDTFLGVSSSLSSSTQSALSNPGVVAPPIPPNQLAAVTFEAVSYTPHTNNFVGYGDDFGTETSNTPGKFTFISIYYQTNNSRIAFKVAGDQTGEDFSSMELVCDHGTWDISNTPNPYNPSYGYTITQTLTSTGPLIDGVNYECKLMEK